MKVNMLDRMTPVLTDACNDSVSVFEPAFLGNLGNRLKYSRNIKRIIRADSIGRLDMTLGNDKNVNGSLRGNITESIDLVVLINLG
jgi:hypothetical protein